MAIVEVRCCAERNKELAAVGVRPAIGHRQNAGLVVAEPGMKLIAEGVAGPADPLAERIAALHHEAVDDTMKDHAVVIRARDLLVRLRVGPLLGAFRQPDEVLNRFRHFLVEQANRKVPFAGDELRVDSGHRWLLQSNDWRVSSKGYHQGVAAGVRSAEDEALDALISGTSDDPFAMLGRHRVVIDGRPALVVRTLQPHAADVQLITGDRMYGMQRRRTGGLFEAKVPFDGPPEAFAYR